MVRRAAVDPIKVADPAAAVAVLVVAARVAEVLPAAKAVAADARVVAVDTVAGDKGAVVGVNPVAVADKVVVVVAAVVLIAEVAEAALI